MRPAARIVSSASKALDRIGVAIKGFALDNGLAFEFLQIFVVKCLRMLDIVDLEIGVDRGVKVDHFVDESLNAQIVDQELDLRDIALEAFRVLNHVSATCCE